MPLPNLDVPLYPNVPLAPGVPPVLRDVVAVLASAPAPLRADAPGLGGGLTAARWGIYFQNGSPALSPDSFVAFDYGKDWRVSDYPLERGGFESYNKVARPYDIRVTLTKGGTDADRSFFLAACEALAESLDLVDVVTPERTYLSANAVHFGLSRSQRAGANLITVELSFMEIRQTVTATYSNIATTEALTDTKTEAAQSTVNVGGVQARALTPSEQAVVFIPFFGALNLGVNP